MCEGAEVVCPVSRPSWLGNRPGDGSGEFWRCMAEVSALRGAAARAAGGGVWREGAEVVGPLSRPREPECRLKDGARELGDELEEGRLLKDWPVWRRVWDDVLEVFWGIGDGIPALGRGALPTMLPSELGICVKVGGSGFGRIAEEESAPNSVIADRDGSSKRPRAPLDEGGGLDRGGWGRRGKGGSGRGKGGSGRGKGGGERARLAL